MNILSLFAGIGGLELGLEAAGLGTTRWQVEINPFARGVLAKHWPDAERFNDVRTVQASDVPCCDIIAAGFPCQDVSIASHTKTGIDGERSGLWREVVRLLRDIGPRCIILENVPTLTFRGLDRVLCDLADHGYDAEWQTVSARDVGLRHRRQRLFIIAILPDADRAGLQGLRPQHGLRSAKGTWNFGRFGRRSASSGLGPVAHVFPGRMDRLMALGNAVCPAVAVQVGRRAIQILERGEVSGDPWIIG